LLLRQTEEEFEDTKGSSKSVNQRRIDRQDNTVTKRKGIKGQTIFHKTLCRKLKIG